MGNVSPAETAQIRYAQRHPVIDMSDRIGPCISKGCRIGGIAGTDTIHDDDNDSFKFHMIHPFGKYVLSFIIP